MAARGWVATGGCRRRRRWLEATGCSQSGRLVSPLGDGRASIAPFRDQAGEERRQFQGINRLGDVSMEASIERPGPVV